MLSSMPGKGLGMAAKRIGEAAQGAKKANPKMDVLKNRVGMAKRKGGSAMSSLPKKNMPFMSPKPGNRIGKMAQATAASSSVGKAASMLAKGLKNKMQ